MIKIKRNSSQGIIGGVCEGVGEYFEIDPVLVRLLFVALFFALGSGIITYVIAWIIIPDKY
tara:strand:- start:693 stop:875 length:183 start_codon:yes stop_codon:yes gene_type:complete